ncbi:hypothetical protein ALC60_08134 [Trachymyrmex zeteki]|uniref:Uncharacterized protein n=1 Tax=Mycetomoellerius zeteki TaxID=64791 RepID=A0A151WXQ1_9HYME|nr:hypothetical protein ALC60_08134 [Trachymyrmex zeteki]
MQSSCLVKYTTRSLYIRTLVVHTYQRRSSSTDPRTIPCYGAIPAGHKGDRSSLPVVTKEASTSSSPAAWLPQKTAAAKLNSPQRGAATNCQPICYTFQRYFGLNKVDPVSRVARILHGSLDVRMFLTYVTSLGDGQGCAATPAKGRDPYPGGTLLSQRPLNRTSHTFPPDANNASFRLRDRSSRFVDRAGKSISEMRERRCAFVTFVSCVPGVIPGVCPSDFWIGARRETPGTERHHEGYFTRIGDKAHIIFASPAHFFFLIRTNGGLMGPLSYDRNSLYIINRKKKQLYKLYCCARLGLLRGSWTTDYRKVNARLLRVPVKNRPPVKSVNS